MKRIFLALALLPALSLPAMAEETLHPTSAFLLTLKHGLQDSCKKGREALVVFIEETKTFAVCDGENWRALSLGEVIEYKGSDDTEGNKK